MGVWESAVLTTRGNELLIDAVAGDRITFTRMVVGRGIYTDEERQRRVLEKMTGLKEAVQEFTFSAHRKVSEQCVLLTAVISNRELAHSYKITEIGIYGKRSEEDEEFLCSIGVTKSLEESDTFPPYNGLQECQIVQDYYITISPDAEVSVNTQGACVLREEFDAIKQTITTIVDSLGSSAYAAVINHLAATEEGGVLDARQGKVLKDMIDAVKKAFQDGCKLIVGRLTALGYAPASPQGPTQIVASIDTMYDGRYNAGVLKGQENVVANPGAFGLGTEGLFFMPVNQTEDVYNFATTYVNLSSGSHSIHLVGQKFDNYACEGRVFSSSGALLWQWKIPDDAESHSIYTQSGQINLSEPDTVKVQAINSHNVDMYFTALTII